MDIQLYLLKLLLQYNQKNPNVTPKEYNYQGQKFTEFVSNEFFTVYKLKVDGKFGYIKPNVYCLVSVIDGNGSVTIDNEKYNIEKGQHFILTNDDKTITFKGDIELIVSYA
ncbi:cupin domain-containing protein [Staphylococcus simiae]|uniref:Phosphohexomutase n=1 Tax=Staphylococcus simiae CCM 7213 = CCUG 51256 TaxID=911238 RepID=G5JID6_9STAP|nr:hypothetical protein [Staphylococcus simiae]EHJ08027.1 mannose-6-phosphate isomerase [Staphylococcus simiae CCM 7213 = CCUG 51256]PNZ14548.1 hypothetical protein CD113_01700 [Staphylococcus simiae]SNV57900.1 mannose-6-phosphate isomerase [Staphylococcus simiae]